MSRLQSAGVLVYRRRNDALEVLLVHPGGPFWQRRDDGAWSIPKGEFSEDELPEAAARREFTEETGANNLYMELWLRAQASPALEIRLDPAPSRARLEIKASPASYLFPP